VMFPRQRLHIATAIPPPEKTWMRISRIFMALLMMMMIASIIQLPLAVPRSTTNIIPPSPHPQKQMYGQWIADHQQQLYGELAQHQFLFIVGTPKSGSYSVPLSLRPHVYQKFLTKFADYNINC